NPGKESKGVVPTKALGARNSAEDGEGKKTVWVKMPGGYNPGGAGSDEDRERLWVTLLNQPDGTAKLLEQDEEGDCHFFRALVHPATWLAGFAQKHPQLIRKITFKQLLEKYNYSPAPSNPILPLAMMLYEDNLSGVVKLLLEELNEADIKALV